MLKNVLRQLNIEGAAIEGQHIVHRCNEITHRMHLVRESHPKGSFAWWVDARMPEYDETLSKFGAMRIGLSRPDTFEGGLYERAVWRYRYPWPDRASDLGERFEHEISEYIAPSLSFFTGLSDFTTAMLKSSNLERGSVWAELRRSTLPARIVKATIIARDLRMSDLEARALSVFEEWADVDMATEDQQSPYLFRRQAGEWARDYQRVVETDLSDFIKAGKVRTGR